MCTEERMLARGYVEKFVSALLWPSLFSLLPEVIPCLCTYCHKNGHDESDCYTKHGFPETWGHPRAADRVIQSGPGGGGAAPHGTTLWPRVAAARTTVAVPPTTHSDLGACDTSVLSDRIQHMLSVLTSKW